MQEVEFYYPEELLAAMNDADAAAAKAKQATAQHSAIDPPGDTDGNVRTMSRRSIRVISTSHTKSADRTCRGNRCVRLTTARMCSSRWDRE